MKREDPELPIYDGDENDNNADLQNQEEEEFDEIYNENEEVDFDPENIENPFEFCSMGDVVFNILRMPKPLGYLMPQEKMENFLKERGYKIIKRYSDSKGEEYSVAIKPGVSFIPEDDYSNVREIFDNEVQDILLKWLLKIGKED